MAVWSGLHADVLYKHNTPTLLWEHTPPNAGRSKLRPRILQHYPTTRMFDFQPKLGTGFEGQMCAVYLYLRAALDISL